jgi:hypothetical protein
MRQADPMHLPERYLREQMLKFDCKDNHIVSHGEDVNILLYAILLLYVLIMHSRKKAIQTPTNDCIPPELTSRK